MCVLQPVGEWLPEVAGCYQVKSGHRCEGVPKTFLIVSEANRLQRCLLDPSLSLNTRQTFTEKKTFCFKASSLQTA